MTPIHAYEMERTVRAAGGMKGESVLKESCELGLAHLAACHRELGVPLSAKARHMTVDPYVVGRIDEDELGLFASQEEGVGVIVEGVAAEKPVRADLPKVAGPGNDRRVGVEVFVGVGRVAPFLFSCCSDQQIDLGCREARHVEVEVEVDLREFLELDRQQIPIPARAFRELIVRDHVGADLILGEVLELERRDGVQAQMLRGTHLAVAGDDGPRRVDEHGVREPKRLDRGRDLADLLLGVGARVVPAKGQRGDRELFDAQIVKFRGRLT